MSTSQRRGVAAVTGGSAGVGRAIVQQLAAKGFDVGIIARGGAGLDAAADDVHKYTRNAVAVAADVADWAAVDGAATRIEQELGPVDVWVNNAMATVFSWSWDVEPSEYRRATEVTYLGQVHGTLAALHRINRSATADLNLSDRLKTAVRVLADTTGADACSIMLYDETPDTLALRAAVGLNPAAVGVLTLHPGMTITGCAAAEQRVIAAPDARRHPSYAPIPATGEDVYASQISVPMVLRRGAEPRVAGARVSFRFVELRHLCAQAEHSFADRFRKG
ncbi:MAG: SDR family NAD(P)-dependent oxidoreductase [Actinobacteria bacterium]|nr:SDR family NAD(P)-dependent oxidoreductase [Actinomycetota bacterium]